MTLNSLLQIGLFLGILFACVTPLGWYMARVYEGNPPGAARLLVPLERLLHRTSFVDAQAEMTWRQYAMATLAFSLVSFLATYALQRVQGMLPLNPEEFPAVFRPTRHSTRRSAS